MEGELSVTSLRVVERDSMDKTKALEAALGQIEKAFGKGSVMKLGHQQNAVDIDSISTGSLGLDIAVNKTRICTCNLRTKRVQMKTSSFLYFLNASP